MNITETNNQSWLSIVAGYKNPDLKKSLCQLANTFIPVLILWCLAYFSLDYSYWLTFCFSLVMGSFIARVFSIMHDCSHGSFFQSRMAMDITGFICGIITLTPFKCWRKIHAVHHAGSSHISKREMGDFPLLTVNEYLALPGFAQLKYRFMRHPLFILGVVPFLLFFILQRMPATAKVFNFTPEEKRSVQWTNLSILAVIVIISSLTGFKAFLLVQLPASLFISTIGVALFYIQHQFEDTYWAANEDFDYYLAAMKGSSFFKLPVVLNWLTGNTGYHHIHHLSPLIPNYKLPVCYAENPQFQAVKPITLSDSFKTFSLALWDESQQKLVSFYCLKQNSQD
jgi:omega-6 fatty acid desaturase (delta-12 desaturase)